MRAMRRFLGLILLLVGTFGFITPWLPPEVTRHVPLDLVQPATLNLVTWGGAGVMLVALLLLFKPRRLQAAIDDAPLRRVLLKRGFEFTEFPDGWLARGDWNDEPVSLRWDSGYHAGRFGRPYVVVLTVPGTPLEPLPLRHDQVVLAEKAAEHFSVILLEAAMSGRQDQIPRRVDEVLAARR